MIYVEQTAAFEASVEIGESGLVGTLEYAIVDNDGTTVTGPTTLLITENVVDGVPTGNYSRNDPGAPSTIGQYQILWSRDGTWDPISISSEDLIVVSAADAGGVLPPIPGPDSGGVSAGPCTAWITGDDVAACCTVESSSGLIFDDVAIQASVLLYELSGRLYPGLCAASSVRPCTDNCSCFPAQRLAYASGGSRLLWTGDYWGWGGNGSRNCGCGCLSRVLLSGYPVREITQVKIDGDVVDPSEYRLDEHRYVTRMNGAFWPSCQDLSLEDTEDGTFSVSYTYGMSPPVAGQAAAGQLACELYKACLGGSGADCQLPSGITRIVRQGITIEKQAFAAWAWSRDRGWHSGLSLVDAFLAAYNPAGIMRRPTFWSPSGSRYARRVG